MRTSAEAHMYMDQQPCTCGDVGFDRQSAVMLDGDVLCSRYFGKCRTCGTMREFIFELPPKQRPITNQVEFGGSDPSRLLDAGQWLGISEYYAKLAPGTRDDLAIARAAVEEVIKFLPDGVESVPDTAFWSARGRAIRDREPARFRRARLAAILDVYRKQLAGDRSFVPAEIRAQFLARLRDTDLPDPLPLGRTVNIYYEVPECLDEERSARGIYQVRAGYDGTYYLDCYFETVALTLFSSHYRIRPDGSREELESLKAGRGEDIAEHNARVSKILQAKGFG